MKLGNVLLEKLCTCSLEAALNEVFDVLRVEIEAGQKISNLISFGLIRLLKDANHIKDFVFDPKYEQFSSEDGFAFRVEGEGTHEGEYNFGGDTKLTDDVFLELSEAGILECQFDQLIDH